MDHYKQYCDIRLRTAPYRKSDDPDCIRAVAAIDALANRAKDIAEGCNPAGRFGWAGNDFTHDSLMERAYEHLEALERGEQPLRGQFAEPGGSLIDHSFIEKDGVLHLFYNRGYIGYLWDQRFVDSIGHATTTDLLHWDIHPPVLTAEAGGHDDYQVWSPAVVEHDGRYWMFYTGVNFHVAQAIMLAVSDDLYHWEKVSRQPVWTAGDWCGWDAGKWSDCRDSMIFKDDDGTFYMYYCSTYPAEDGTRRACVGAASSRDLIHWQEEGFITVPNLRSNAESPYVMKKDGKYYLFYTNCGFGTCYAVSDYPLKGWTVLPDDKNFLVATCCTEVFSYGGKWYLSLATYRGRGEQYLEIAECIWQEDGTISMGDFLR
ncbi:MAG: family 43 glycosylhydrolase [Clostridia bacterium]|nr:family 43 glycosylhydrolase [Clostridia bacterium]